MFSKQFIFTWTSKKHLTWTFVLKCRLKVSLLKVVNFSESHIRIPVSDSGVETAGCRMVVNIIVRMQIWLNFITCTTFSHKTSRAGSTSHRKMSLMDQERIEFYMKYHLFRYENVLVVILRETILYTHIGIEELLENNPLDFFLSPVVVWK